MPRHGSGLQTRDWNESKPSWLIPLKMSDAHALNSLALAARNAVNAAEILPSHANRQSCKRHTETAIAQLFRGRYRQIPYTQSVGNSDNERGAGVMPYSQIARDDEEIRCVSPQRLVSASSRVLPFTPPRAASSEDRLRELRSVDPETAAMIDGFIEKMHKLRC
jgi:hypothetical protein